MSQTRPDRRTFIQSSAGAAGAVALNAKLNMASATETSIAFAGKPFAGKLFAGKPIMVHHEWSITNGPS